ncbi:transmembrane protein 186 isoform A [Alligator mississippiensis]|uniref:Transmembrane protein 186 n=1 Tax=Alligator mississippiensis TaxID=8496 RepID=A0A151N0X9_ALLMI|nr:transmembrane protein 186 isoform A [Alligator mississippiensis]
MAALAFVVLYGLSYYLRRLIGLIYLSETGGVVRVAHLTFWGWRHDIDCPTTSVMALGDTGDRRGELLLQFKRYDSPQVYKEVGERGLGEKAATQALQRAKKKG